MPEGESAAGAAGAAANERAALKAKEHLGEVFEVVGARDAQGQFGPQVALQVKGGRHVIFVGAKSGIAKGLKNGKLHPSVATPLRVTATMAYGSKEPFAAWTLAPKLKPVDADAANAAPAAAAASAQ